MTADDPNFSADFIYEIQLARKRRSEDSFWSRTTTTTTTTTITITITTTTTTTSTITTSNNNNDDDDDNAALRAFSPSSFSGLVGPLRLDAAAAAAAAANQI